ncbi:right-handed parallel beta-helix repeat-containing protein [Candidatus Poribacteria bacterium]|nr:right-handed parallel beta-helix repeat-containing protein [Candidatus Poribacteria bacterium]
MNRNMQMGGYMMMTSCIRKLLGVVVLSAIVASGPSLSQAATTIDRNISGNAVWRAKQSPYIVKNNIRLEEGATLQIQPGVRIELGPEKTIELRGKLTAVGTPEKPIIFTAQTNKPWGTIHFTDFSDDALFSESGDFISGCIMRNCVVEKGQGIFIRFGAPFITQCDIRDNVSSGIRIEFGAPRIVGNHIHGNSTREDFASGNGGGIIAYTDRNVLIADNTINNNISEGGRHGGGGIYAYAYEGGHIIVRDNVIYGNTSDRFGGGMYAYETQILRNTVIGNTAAEKGGGVYAVDSLVRENLIQSNTAGQGGGAYAENAEIVSNSVIGNIALNPEGGGLYYFGSGKIHQNSFAGNKANGENACGGVYVSGNPDIHENNLLNNRGFGLRVANVAEAPYVMAARNYWGAAERAILHLTFDWLDNDEVGLASCLPSLDSLATTAPAPPPVNVIATAKNEGVELSWEEPQGLLFEGHKVYAGTGSGYPYESAIQIGPDKRCMISDLKQGQEYFFAVSGYQHVDSRLVETGFSEELKIRFTGRDESLAPPQNVSPSDGETALPRNAVLTASTQTNIPATGAPEMIGAIDSSRWQISTSPADFTAPAADVLLTGDKLLNFNLAGLDLLANQTYFWRVAYRKTGGSWSQWSKPTGFTTIADSPSLLAGPITTTLKLRKSLSPYVMVDNVLVMPGGALEIEPGVHVRVAGGKNLMVRGKLAAKGTLSNPITFTADSDARWGKIIFADLSQDVQFNSSGDYLDGCILERCVVEKGKGILIESASPLIKDSTIAYHEGSGLAIRQGGPVITGNDIHDNVSATNGGGVYAYTNDIIHITSNKIHHNKAGGDGGGVFAYGYMNTSTIRVEGNDIFGNKADGDGGGVFLSRSSAVGNDVESNRADGDGGGIYSTFGLVDNNKVHDNEANHGGGVYAERNSAMTRNRVSSNKALSRFGGGVYINFWGASIENEVFTQNTVSANTGLSDEDNGGVFVVGYLIFERNNIYGNSGTQLYNGNEAPASPFVASECYWGTTDENTIRREIAGGHLNPQLGEVTFTPFASGPVKFD